MRIPSPSASGTAASLGLCILAGCALIAGATWARGDSTPRRQARATHVGVPATDFVTLRSTGSGSSLKFLRVGDDGTTSTDEFGVPAGSHLIVTDVSWAGKASSLGNWQTLRIFIESVEDSSKRSIVHMIQASDQAGSTNNAFAAVNVASPHVGFAVSSAGLLKADLVNSTNSVTAPHEFAYPGVTAPITVVLHGYLVSDE